MSKLTLKAARVNVGMSQKDAAAKLGISNKTLCGWENCTSYPKVNQIDSICNLYGICYDDLIFLPSVTL